MAAFDFVLVLLSFVYALAVAVVLQSAGRLIIERHRVKFSGLLALAMFNAVVTVFISWLGMWDYRDTKGITLYDVTIFFVSALRSRLSRTKRARSTWPRSSGHRFALFTAPSWC